MFMFKFPPLFLAFFVSLFFHCFVFPVRVAYGILYGSSYVLCTLVDLFLFHLSGTVDRLGTPGCRNYFAIWIVLANYMVFSMLISHPVTLLALPCLLGVARLRAAFHRLFSNLVFLSIFDLLLLVYLNWGEYTYTTLTLHDDNSVSYIGYTVPPRQLILAFLSQPFAQTLVFAFLWSLYEHDECAFEAFDSLAFVRKAVSVTYKYILGCLTCFVGYHVLCYLYPFATFANLQCGLFIGFYLCYAALILCGVGMCRAAELERLHAAHLTLNDPPGWKRHARLLFGRLGPKERKRRYVAFMRARMRAPNQPGVIQGGLAGVWNRTDIDSTEKMGTIIMAIMRFFQMLLYAAEHPDPGRGQLHAVLGLCSDLGMNGGFHRAVGAAANSLLSMGGIIQSGSEEHSEAFNNLGKVLRSLRNGTELSAEVWNSPGIVKVKRVLMLVFTMYVHTDDKSDPSLIQELLSSRNLFEPPITSRVDAVCAVGDLLLHVCETGYQYARTGSLDVMFHGATQYEQFYDDMKWLNDHAPYLLSPQAKGFTEATFLARLSSCVERGKSIVERARLVKCKELRVLERVYADLLAMEATVLSRSFARQEREMPFSLLVSGPSSVGKTAVCNALHQHFAHVMGENPAAEFKYTRNPFTDFWDGFRTECWCIQLDDVAFMKPNGTIDPSVVEFLQIMNCVPYCPNQAALSEKGRTPIRAKLVIASTNTLDLNTFYYFAEPSAVNRRFPIVIIPSPRPEFAGPNGQLVVPPGYHVGPYPDLWHFKVLRIGTATTPKGVATQTVVASSLNMQDLLRVLNSEYANFRRIQDSMNASLEEYKTSEHCAGCQLPLQYCSCGQEVFAPPPPEPQDEDLRETDSVTSHERWWSQQLDADDFAAGELQSSSRPLIDLSFGAWRRWWDSLWTKVSPTEIIVWGGLWQSIMPGSTDHLYLLFTLLFVRIYIPFYGLVRRRVVVGLIERHLASTVGWIFYCWPEARGTLAQMLYQYSVRYDECESFWSFKALKRSTWAKMGASRARDLKRGIIALTIAAAVTSSGMVLYRLFKSSDILQSNGFSSDEVREPTPMESERFDPWRVGHATTVRPPTSKQASSSRISELINRTGPNVHHTESINEVTNCTTPGTMVGIGGQYFLANNHLIPEGTTTISFRRAPGCGKVVGPNFAVSFDESMINRDPARDLAVLYIPSSQPCKSLLEYFPMDDTFQGPCKATTLLNRQGDRSNVYYRCIRRQERDTPIGKLDMFAGEPDRPTLAGDCGSPMLADTARGPMIVGVHVMKIPGTMYGKDLAASTVVTRPWLDEYMGKWAQQDPIIQSGELDICKERGYSLGPLHYKSVFQYLNEGGNVDIYGTLTGANRARNQSSVGHTRIHQVLVERLGWVGRMCVPDLISWRPWWHAAKALVAPVIGFNEEILAKCADGYYEDVLSGLSPEALSQFEVYDTFTAINGCPGVTYVDSMNRQTSAGYPWGHPKSSLLIHLGSHRGRMHAVDVVPEVHERLRKMEENARQGIRNHPIFTAILKDEPVSQKKGAIGKTRIISAAPFDWGILFRKYFLSFVRVQQNNRILFEAASGTIAQSSEWGDLYRYLAQFGGRRMIAGDYKDYDKNMPTSASQKAFEVKIRLAQAAGATRFETATRRSLMVDTCFPTTNFNGDLVMFHGSNPSGHPGTVQINSIVNSLYMRYCFVVLGEEHGFTVKDFRKHVALITYGDDNVMGVSDEVPWFNHTSIAATLADVGITYTMADKEAQSVPYITIDEVSFLKRKWVWEDDLGDYACPLDINSIHKMLMYRTMGNDTEEQQLANQIRSAHGEFFYHGREVFKEHDQFLRDLLVEFELHEYVDPDSLPTWDEYVARWRAVRSTGVPSASGESH